MKTHGKPILYIYVNNHFDPIWRRCWDRRFTFNGDTFISYADIESYYLLDNLELARQHPEYKFEAESSLVVQKFLERHPDKLEALQQLQKEKRFAITGGGQVIVDTNLIQGESIIRNYLTGFLYVEDTFGQKTHLVVRNDGFGNSAQLPQILRGVEINWATGLSYSPAQGIYWRGLDGSVIVHAELPHAAQGGGVIKYAPCAACRGSGEASGGQPGFGKPCPQCHGRGIDPNLKALLPDEVNPDAFKDGGVAVFKMGPEELLPNPALIDWARGLEKDYDVHFALEEEAFPHLAPYFERLDNPPEADIHPSVELNPNNTGVYVTRIRTKQNVRRQEYAIAATELLALMAALKGRAYPRQKLADAWKPLLFTMFHDSITATTIDPAYAEILDMVQEIDDRLEAVRAEVLPAVLEAAGDVISVVNPVGSPVSQVARVSLPGLGDEVTLVDDSGREAPSTISRLVENGPRELSFIASQVPAFSSRQYRLVAGGASSPTPPSAPSAHSIENQRFKVMADAYGLVSVFDKTLNLDVLKTGEYRPGELILEHDEGSPWATLHPDQSRTPLAGFSRLVGIEATPICQRMTFEVGAPFRSGYVAGGFKARLAVTLWDGIPRVDFNLSVDWDTFNHRLRVAMPVTAPGKAIYEIPYGMLERQPYQPDFHWYAANGDWPAINWAGVETQNYSVALLNKGLPSYRIEPAKDQGQTILLSVLRSPAIPTYLHEPDYYTMTGYDGMRDSGRHEFEFALSAYAERFADSSVVLDAESYNAGVLTYPGKFQPAQLPQLTSDNCRLSAIKWAEKGNAMVLRLVEFRGKGGEARLSLPPVVRTVEKTNMLERLGEPLAVVNGSVSLTLRPWEIATLRLEL